MDGQTEKDGPCKPAKTVLKEILWNYNAQEMDYFELVCGDGEGETGAFSTARSAMRVMFALI